ncbi:MAG TPA: ABC transporter permease [Chryseosolibacter sp.]|nr:ABC transporter permease [Chryseosolibacter sp.]
MTANEKMPPRIFLRFFRWYCHPKLVNSIEGDLLEEYQVHRRTVGKMQADARFVMDVILLFRPGIIRPPQPSHKVNPIIMYKSYFTIAWRNLLRNGGYSFINIGGLAIGLTIVILNALWIWDEVSYNKYHENYERIAQVAETGYLEGKRFLRTSQTYSLGTELIENYHTHFKRVARTSWIVVPTIAAGEKKANTVGLYVDSSMPGMFTFEMIEGTRSALSKPQSIILSSSFAKSLFGYDDPVNKTVRINNTVDATVTGVYNDLPLNTKFSNIKFFGSWDLFLLQNPWIEKRALHDLRNHFIQIYLELHEANTFSEATSALAPALKFDPADADEAKKIQKRLALYPMRDWHLYPYARGELDRGPIVMVTLVGAIGLFILLLACINFMNLSTARSEKRRREVGIRKTIGSVRSQLIGQFFSESFLIVLFALIMALALTSLCLPAFNDLAGKDIALPWTSTAFWIACLTVTIVTSLLAGSYPALYLSSFNPITALKGNHRTGRLATLPRKVLVVVQFSISVILINCTAVIYQQIQFAKNRPVGYDRDGLLMIEKRTSDFYDKYDVLRAELKNSGVVEEVSESMGMVTEAMSGNNGWDWQGHDPNLEANFVTLAVSHTHGKTVNWDLLAGRDFSIDNPGDSSGIIINEAAAKFMGLENPIGERLTWKWWVDGRVLDYKILGVIKNPVMDSPYDSDQPAVFYLKGFNGTPNWIHIRIVPNVHIADALPLIENVFKKVIPSAPFDYKFADDEYARMFAYEERTGKLATVFTVLAIFISCLGLFGLASFVAEQRTKEIGIRKVLGATVMNVWRMLSKDFIILVLIACALSVPLAYYLMSQWLQNYSYRVDLSLWTFSLTCVVAILITICTVSFQAIKAGVANPVRSLRYD